MAYTIRLRRATHDVVARGLVDAFIVGDTLTLEVEVPFADLAQTGVVDPMVDALSTIKAKQTDADPGLGQVVGVVVDPGTVDTDGLVRYAFSAARTALLARWRFVDCQVQQASGAVKTVATLLMKGASNITVTAP